ncbi:Gp49 family protein [Thioalkalivibrio sp. ALE12]|uniref:Gp49 family protein n=1 Tax=Thioalkalivibrio sp. ALE12 TaxID=1158170 RepID=UPI00036A08F6|nr:Gp49 family protein [Thioalkalivibrio sp. ALE12]
MQNFIGVKQVQAEPQERDGQAGYRVVYPNGYESWSPQEVFESAYLEIGEDPTRVDEAAVEEMDAGMDAQRMGNHTVVRLQLRNGFSIVADSACVEAANYSEEIGTDLALEEARDEVWAYLGFVLAWARNGLQKAE